jgi:DNA-directed RNA polymerase subunit RPC12/RpoP
LHGRKAMEMYKTALVVCLPCSQRIFQKKRETKKRENMGAGE